MFCLGLKQPEELHFTNLACPCIFCIFPVAFKAHFLKNKNSAYYICDAQQEIDMLMNDEEQEAFGSRQCLALGLFIKPVLGELRYKVMFPAYSHPKLPQEVLSQLRQQRT
ncbi:hypothetical protein QQP08_004380, partial [Theobroma cacao]